MTRKRRWLIILTVLGVLVVAGGVTMGWIQHQRQASKITARPVPQAQLRRHVRKLIDATNCPGKYARICVLSSDLPANRFIYSAYFKKPGTK